MDPAGDDRLGSLAKFSPPVVANGKVYVGTFSRELVVYGQFEESGRPRRANDAGIFELRNVGKAEKEGSYTCGKYELRISGQGIGVIPVFDDQTKAKIPGKWEDAFLFANVQRNMRLSRVAVTAFIEGLSAPDDSNPLAGVIIRRDSGPGDVFAAVFINNQKEILFIHRDNPQGAVVTAKHDWQGQNATIQVFIRIVAQNVDLKPGFVGFTGELSKNGSNWNRIGDVTEIKMDVEANIAVKVGLAVSAQTYPKDPAFLAHATFSSVDVTGG